MVAIRWGILGAAKFAREQMAPAINAAQNARLAALATSDAAKAAPFDAIAPGIQVFTGRDFGIALEPQHWPDAPHHGASSRTS